MDSSSYFDTGSLRDHVSEILEEQRTAQRLYETVRFAKNTGDPLVAQGYDRVLNSIETLQRYFERMAIVLDDAAVDASRVYKELGICIQDSTDRLRDINDRMMI